MDEDGNCSLKEPKREIEAFKALETGGYLVAAGSHISKTTQLLQKTSVSNAIAMTPPVKQAP
ncbi:MAG: hypothetical protein Q4E24_03830 [bacterium]|nr:hypothetical protein [bacterium]